MKDDGPYATKLPEDLPQQFKHVVDESREAAQALGIDLVKGGSKADFHQPAVWIINKEGEPLWHWNSTSKVGNGFGATGRPNPQQVLEAAVE